MQPLVFISLALLVFSQISVGHTEESTADATNKDAATETDKTLSRAKRGSYDMMRLGRGLHMLRLGKRNGASYPADAENVDELLNFLQENYGQYPLYPNSLDGDEDFVYPEEEAQMPSHPRFRRSTPSTEGVVPPEVLQQASSDLKDSAVPEMEDEELDVPYLIYPEDDDYLYSGLEDLTGLQEGGNVDKRQLSMLRLGKRSLSMLRLGKREGGEEEAKRALNMLRLGKRPMSMLRLGKRPMSMLRLGKRPDETLDEAFNEEEKRPMSMLRLGKRPMSMLRLGKRPMSMLRLGKRPMSMLRLGKRPMSMLRLGKRPMSMLRLGKRPMSMLRLGKRPMSMLRLGKRDPEDQEDKRSLSMLRLGKRSTE